MGISMGIPILTAESRAAACRGDGISIPIPTLWGSPWIWVRGGYGDRNSIPTAALIGKDKNNKS